MARISRIDDAGSTFADDLLEWSQAKMQPFGDKNLMLDPKRNPPYVLMHGTTPAAFEAMGKDPTLTALDKPWSTEFNQEFIATEEFTLHPWHFRTDQAFRFAHVTFSSDRIVFLVVDEAGRSRVRVCSDLPGLARAEDCRFRLHVTGERLNVTIKKVAASATWRGRLSLRPVLGDFSLLGDPDTVLD
eukprot:TRINITY_DN12518_c0_g1_i2.p1 TRINITY_DN12518_c0_g1~~TRINITY_DN12518_c0_g1_i2.p1  ORF type:complete len:187 (-),score=25.01 TRINITY_DN12518_c0_g1_i2:122-682(-)